MNLESPLWRRCYLHLRWYFVVWGRTPYVLRCRHNAVHGPRGDRQGSAWLWSPSWHMVSWLYCCGNGHGKTTICGTRWFYNLSNFIIPLWLPKDVPTHFLVVKVHLKLQCSKLVSTKFILKSRRRCRRLPRISFSSALLRMPRNEQLQLNCWKSLSSMSKSRCKMYLIVSEWCLFSFSGKKKKMSRLSISSQAGGSASEFNRSVSVPAIGIQLGLGRNFSGSRWIVTDSFFPKLLHPIVLTLSPWYWFTWFLSWKWEWNTLWI